MEDVGRVTLSDFGPEYIIDLLTAWRDGIHEEPYPFGHPAVVEISGHKLQSPTEAQIVIDTLTTLAGTHYADLFWSMVETSPGTLTEIANAARRLSV